MKIKSAVHKLLFFKATDLYPLKTKIRKNILSSYESKTFIRICRQLKYHQLRTGSEICILPLFFLREADVHIWQHIYQKD